MAGNLPESFKKILADIEEQKRLAAEEARQRPIREFRTRQRKNLWDALHEVRCKNFDAFRRLHDRNQFTAEQSQHSWDLELIWESLWIISEKREARQFLQQHIPDQFHAFDPELFPCPTALRKVLALPFPQKYDIYGRTKPDFRGGIMGFGPTGLGKTRAMFERLKKISHERPCERFKVVSAPFLKRQLDAASRSGKVAQIIDEILAPRRFNGETFHDILFIDDLSQARFTSSFAENLFELINRIYSEQRLLIVTVQTTNKELVEKWCAGDPDLKDTAHAIVRRLKEYCVQVEFTDETRRPHSPIAKPHSLTVAG